MTREKESVLLSKIPFEATRSFSGSFLDYIGGKEALKPFYTAPPLLKNFDKQLAQRHFPPAHRPVLNEALHRQYRRLETSEQTKSNINLLKDTKTFTITTGHQLNIFTGPLYLIYKIVTVINACKRLKQAYPDYHFVPVYWMASEDHDFEEISHFRFNGKTFKWKTEQTGAVGRFDPKELQPFFDEIMGMPELFRKAYLQHNTLAEAVRYYVNALFGAEGLVVMDADDSALKSLLKPVIEDDLFKGNANRLVKATSEKLETAGYKPQVFPREINFFYLKDHLRSRLVPEGDCYRVLDTDITFTKEALKTELSQHPERFSPNVVLRPLYQEIILPNLAYVGGPSELLYWLQLKAVFNHFNTAFPLLMPRNFAGILTPNIQSKLEKEGLRFEEIFEEEQSLIRRKVAEKSQNDLTLGKERQQINALFDQILKQTTDSSLEQLIAAERKKAQNSLGKVERKLLKAEKRNQETLVNRIYAIKEALFPGGSPQERTDNFLNFYIPDPNFVQSCLANFDAFDYRFHLIKGHE